MGPLLSVLHEFDGYFQIVKVVGLARDIKDGHLRDVGHVVGRHGAERLAKQQIIGGLALGAGALVVVLRRKRWSADNVTLTRFSAGRWGASRARRRWRATWTPRWQG